MLRSVPVANLVSGDIVKVTMGSKIPADLRMLQCSPDLRFDRSILTGESKAVSGTVDNTDSNLFVSSFSSFFLHIHVGILLNC